ncbi:tetrahydrofolate dehydrogenase/cyclohydrolase catalytic domain-containing protein, partial [Raoultella planticola]|uniref:tetrahydrofolate dehydrogenase/cyclohydrolase catalytic domain-containing protein n=2 Tax=Pseudomonadota TaxID=1224 RepID=UPI0035C8E937|nr:bifunctional methylenetetrahydrofolate dehydrogenase/methenyltetrahydrofolate cyclohydrolase [Raoultella planticola]
REAGMESFEHKLGADTTQATLIALVDKLNADPEVDGILVQLPLPDHIDEQAVLTRIDPDKDVDGFHPVNAGRLATGLHGFVP